MAVEGYILSVGCGNMAALKFPNGKKVLIDCNLKEDDLGNDKIISFLKSKGFDKFDIFINTHRDIDHLRNIKLLDLHIPISTIYDNGVSGTTDASDYGEYMELKRNKTSKIIKPQTFDDKSFGSNVTVRYLNGNYDDVDYDINDTSLVVKIEFKKSSIMFAGDASSKPWMEKVIPYYKKVSNKIKSSLLVASHHGSDTFFDYPDEGYYYSTHINTIKPDMVVVSVGDNPHGLPKKTAINKYDKHAKGSDNGTKVVRTDEKGHVFFELKDEGGWKVDYGK